MKVQKFRGPSMRDALLEVTKELGKDAVILQSRKVTEGGLLGVGTKNLVEVTAALDNNEQAFKQPEPFDRNPYLSTASLPPVDKSMNEKQELRLISLTKQVEGLQDTLMDMSHRLQYPKAPSLPDPFGVYFIRLVDSGIQQETASKLLKRVYENLGGLKLAQTAAMERKITENISRLLQRTTSMRKNDREPLKTVVIGPTGVGKTTTIAKLAASARLYKKLNVALITADTFRIAAVEQIRAFADILKIPMEVVYSRAEMKKALDIHAEKDAIFIDTTGRNPGDSENVSELLGIVKAANPHNVHLVLSSTTDIESQKKAIKGFGLMNIDSLIFTKLDESSRPGTIIDVAASANKPISYLTDGQEVPKDIKVWNANEFARALIRA
ncbi:MAG: flagellar biosynthesis protein FlhF [Candidatus Marinimicrobia bacterium]|nr:flagellar biosynthesis protein FlhF [Candidatus Neomarinimicrobiota bacterium]